MAYMNFLRNNPLREPPMSCKIILLPEKSSYNPGDEIRGKLIVSHQKDFTTLGFKVVLEGRALVKFKEREIIQSKHVTLLETSVFVCGKGDTRIRLLPADHTFPFTLALPKTPLPGSFKSPYGLVLYQIVACLSTEYRDVKKAEKAITVNAFVNLALTNDTSIPVQLEKTERCILPPALPSFLSGRRNTPQFKFVLKLPQSGFLAGEEIPFMLEVDNPYAHEIKNMSVTLVQRITYHAGSSWKTTNIALANLESAHMDSPYGTLWTGAINIPAKQYPTQSKGIIEQQYVLKVVVNTSGQVTPLKGEIPIIIGSLRIPEPSPISSSPPTRSFLEDSTSYSVFRSRSPICFSGASVNSGVLGPPSYSTLSLRTRSSSIETLPPAYDEATKDQMSPNAEKDGNDCGVESLVAITLTKDAASIAAAVSSLDLADSQNQSE